MKTEQKVRILRIAASAVITAVLLILRPSGIAALAAYLIAYIIIGYDVIFEAIKRIIKGKVLDEHFLMLIATVGAFLLSEYPEALAVMLFYQVGEAFGDAAVDKSRSDVTALLDLRPDRVTLITDGQSVTVSPSELHIGDTVSVSAGQRVPTDCSVIKGTALLDTSAITGEGMPKSVSAGDAVTGGSIVLDATLMFRVEKEYSDSTVAKMLELVEKASEHKAKSESFVSRFAAVYTPIVTASALLVAVIPMITGLISKGVPDLSTLNDAIAFLVVSCPCALVLSVPLGYFSGIGSASKRGVLIKGSDTLEKLASVDTVVFDKTGTLTTGSFEVSEVFAVKGNSREMLMLAAAAEKESIHPVARAICEYTRDLRAPGAENVTEKAGMGTTAEISGMTVSVGNAALMEKIGINVPDVPCGTSAAHIAADGEYLGYIAVSDKVKPNAADAVKKLRAYGVRRTVMLTGDGETAARRAAEKTGIVEYRASLLPDGKAELLQSIKRESVKGSVVFVGDGINDAPVLKVSDVGMAMGALGSDAAVEAADAVIMNDDLESIADAVKTAVKTKRIVTENIVFSITVKVLVMLSGLIFEGSAWILPTAVFADVGVSVLAVLNSLRLLLKKH